MSELDRAGRSELHYAAGPENDVAKIHRLIAAGADANLADKAGMTPLHFAAQDGNVEAAMILLDAGADVDPQDSYGNTPLWKAVFSSKGDGKLIVLLRSRGADPLLENANGETPLSLARLIANYPIAQWFADLPD